jgi:hypothetical protein
MEALNFPRPVPPVSPSDRVKRARPRQDSGQGHAFSRPPPRPAAPPAEADGAGEEPAGAPAAPAPEAAEPGPGRRVDIRV